MPPFSISRTVETAALALLLVGCSAPAWGPGQAAPAAPVQEETAPARWDHEGFAYQARAEFALEARVLGVRWYGKDPESAFAPVDVALGWGPMSDDAVLARLDISQWGRWYHYRWDAAGPPIPVADIIRSSANMHLAPATPQVRQVLEDVEEGDLLRLSGALVNVRGPSGATWKTSLTRKDAGGGSCEIVWVEQAERTPAPGR